MSARSSFLVPHNPPNRRLWMFSRPVRRIEPWKVAQYLSIFEAMKDQQWTGNQDSQNFFQKTLVKKGLVRDAEPYDPKSGGPRTYEAQLRSLGLVYRTKRRTLEFTLAGESICHFDPPLLVLQTQLLRQQYPSHYSLSPQVRIHREMRVKPFLFLLRLMKRLDIGAMTTREMMIPVIYGHNHRCEDLCAVKIQNLRAEASVESQIDNPVEDLYTFKTSGNSVEERIADVADIANTGKNFLEACLLIRAIDRDGESAYEFNPDAADAFEKASAELDSFIPNPDNEESFQRAYGAWKNEKDTRRQTAGPAKRDVKSELIRAHFFEYCGTHVVSGDAKDLVDYVATAMGIAKEEVFKTIEPLIPRCLDVFETRYLALASGGTKTATQFEQATCDLFVNNLGLKTAWIGSRRKSRDEKGAFTDLIFYSPAGEACALADTKAMSYYNLPATDYAKMVSNYIPNVASVRNGDADLKACTYVAGGFSESFDHEAGKLSRETGKFCSGITANNLLKLSKNKLPPSKNWDTFIHNGQIKPTI